MRTRDIKLSDTQRLKSTNMKDLFPFLSDVEVIVMKKNWMVSPIDEFVCAGLCASNDFYGNIGRDSSEVRIRRNMKELYQFIKRKSGSCGALNDDNYFKYVSQDEEYESDEEYPKDTFVAVIYADNINEFIEENNKLGMKYDFANPLDHGEHHETDVYVCSPTTFPPNGFFELLGTSATVHLIIREEFVDQILKNKDLRTQNQEVVEHVE